MAWVLDRGHYHEFSDQLTETDQGRFLPYTTWWKQIVFQKRHVRSLKAMNVDQNSRHAFVICHC
jgi:hypothetical protein